VDCFGWFISRYTSSIASSTVTASSYGHGHCIFSHSVRMSIGLIDEMLLIAGGRVLDARLNRRIQLLTMLSSSGASNSTSRNSQSVRYSSTASSNDCPTRWNWLCQRRKRQAFLLDSPGLRAPSAQDRLRDQAQSSTISGCALDT